MTTPRRPKPRRYTKSLQSRLIERIVEADLSPAQLAGELGLSLAQLAAWASQPANARTLEALARLADVRAQMLVSQYRANAAIRLIAIASAEQPTELARKACVDLLHTDLDVFAGSSQATADEPQQPAAPSEEAILAALERLGEEQQL